MAGLLVLLLAAFAASPIYGSPSNATLAYTYLLPLEIVEETMKEMGISYHSSGTMVSIEGPRFSSRAESHMFRQWNADVINMTTCPEVALANEAGMPYVSIAMVTDYDCWKEGEEAANVEAIMAVMGKNKQNTTDCLLKCIPKFKDADWKPVVEAAQTKANSSVMLF